MYRKEEDGLFAMVLVAVMKTVLLTVLLVWLGVVPVLVENVNMRLRNRLTEYHFLCAVVRIDCFALNLLFQLLIKTPRKL